MKSYNHLWEELISDDNIRLAIMIKGGLYMWYKAKSSELPSTIDDTSSRVYVYVRKNINVEQRTDESGEIITVYVYDESKIPKEVYEVLILFCRLVLVLLRPLAVKRRSWKIRLVPVLRVRNRLS